MKNNPLISIIIAFYNEEDFLDRCLHSVSSQTYNRFEVILINDGSTDFSLKIAKEYADSFFKANLITIQNSGHAEARNIGLENCTGDYVTFLDADDLLEPNMIEVFIEDIKSFKADIAICDISVYSEDGKISYNSNWNGELSKKESTNELINQMYCGGISENVWAKVFRTNLAKQIVFEKGLWFDDRPFLLEYLHLSETASFVNKKLLKIYRRNSSITRRELEPKRIVDAYRVFELELDISKKYNNLNDYKNKIGKFTLNVFMDTYIMQIIDEKRIIDIDIVRKTFLKYLVRFKKEIEVQNINMKLKDKIALQLIILPRLLGWNFTNLAFYFLKGKRINAIKRLKNQ
ncbi:glycosyltransferase family 2 protein [Flavivirga algicola]|uniref:Glycosyltransferase n=1 Tax=Flavivirga algicola TaxID=2729136 RepID=A0ABX1RSZ5_9FLAO|nr:glycosyltransferase [Flavivirga algicola]NMH86666.1 glycosyltransferase [Flavivirga algicola]